MSELAILSADFPFNILILVVIGLVITFGVMATLNIFFDEFSKIWRVLKKKVGRI
jgi:predicted RND superfamily exporter protein